MAKSARCEICKTRPQMPKAKMKAEHGVDFPYCEPCLEEANWENVHSDDDHEGLLNRAKTAKEANVKNKAEILAALERHHKEIEHCWICQPELNEASKDYVARSAGTSRKGMVMNVKRSMGPVEKAAVVVAAVEALKGETKTRKAKGAIFLTATTAAGVLKTSWDPRGYHEAATSTWTQADGKVRKIRNVAQCLRLLAGEKA
jgi:hypothetical protein